MQVGVLADAVAPLEVRGLGSSRPPCILRWASEIGQVQGATLQPHEARLGVRQSMAGGGQPVVHSFDRVLSVMPTPW
jgi:hypothetical protein